MSRIGRLPVAIPPGVSVKINKNSVIVAGPKGQLNRDFPPEINLKQEVGQIIVTRNSDHRTHRSKHGLTRSLLNNMVIGVSEGFTKTLLIEGVGYRAEMNGKTLILNVGYSHPVPFEPEADLAFAVEERGKKIMVSGINKQVVGEISARIRKTRPPEPYKGKGIRYEGEYVRRKAGKAGKV